MLKGMTKRITYARLPLELPLGVGTDPPPVPGCDVCGALAGERDEARTRRDMSKVSDVNVEIRRHPNAKRRGQA